MLEVQHVSKSFGGVTALNNCSLRVEQGSIFGLIGPNGSGKTTLFNVVTGFLRADAGEVRFRGKRIDREPIDGISRLGIGRTFQQNRVFADMNVTDHLLLGPKGQLGENVWRLWWRSPKHDPRETENRRRAEALLKQLRLSHLSQERAGNLSYGQQKLLALGMTLMADPDLLMLDEPAAGVNPALLEQIMEVIRSLRDSGMTFLIVEHNMPFIMRLCDRIFVLHHGSKVTEGSPEEVRADPRVMEAYLGAPDVGTPP